MKKIVFGRKGFNKLSADDKVFFLFVDVMMFAVLLLVVLPMLNVISSSVSDPNAVMQGRVFIFPEGFSLAGYKAVLKDSKILNGYLNAILYTGATSFLGVITTILAAYPLSRKDFVGRNGFMMLFTFTMLFSGGLIPSYLLIRDLGLIDNRLSLILPGLVNTYNIIITRTFFQSNIPDDLLDAARIDGCGNTKFFIKIVIPLSKSILAVIALYFIVANWNAWFKAYLYLNDKSKFPLQLVIKEILFANSMNAADGASAASNEGVKMDALSEVIKYSSIMVSCIPLWCIYPFVQKYFVKGVMIGSIKG
ncbi:MAG: carbohydrate ABC transporter permease [Clostridia bacterium]|nr:carbohydrate ABC transporter permease [Clostridia bacterium]